MHTVREISSYLEELAPLTYQESYDNSGLLVGDPEMTVTGVMVSLDVIPDVIEEAKDKGCNLIISHHPILFTGLKSLTGTDYIQKTILSAIKNEIALYAIHTNLDNVLANGVNQEIAQHVGLESYSILDAKSEEMQFEVSVSSLLKNEFISELQAISDRVGLGRLSYHHFEVSGQKSRFVKIYASSNYLMQIKKACNKYGLTLRYTRSSQKSEDIGSGVISNLPMPISEVAFFDRLKTSMGVSVIRHSRLLGRSVSKIAICGGSGSFLLQKAISMGADVFLSADFKYHQFFDANDKIVIADIGHYESEHFTIELLKRLLTEKFSNFAAHCTTVVTNPVYYY